ncbi:MAG: hypothetical protein IPI16_05765 [Comamonadaceae bacterium]|nr:hypothetical protein [Comamonadaceae bacterium]
MPQARGGTFSAPRQLAIADSTAFEAQRQCLRAVVGLQQDIVQRAQTRRQGRNPGAAGGGSAAWASFTQLYRRFKVPQPGGHTMAPCLP